MEDKCLGKGSFGTVYMKRIRGKDVAVKWCHDTLDSDDIYRIQREVRILQGLRHTNVIRFLGTLSTDFQEQFGIIMELAKGGSLAEHLKQGRKYCNRYDIIAQIASGLAYLHEKTILHRDLKPANILFRDISCKYVAIADFGLADHMTSAPYMGAVLYRPPDGHFTAKSDVYCLAVVACCIILCEHAANEHDITCIIRRAKQQLQQTPPKKRVMDNALSLRPTDRPTALDFLEYWERPYYTPTVQSLCDQVSQQEPLVTFGQVPWMESWDIFGQVSQQEPSVTVWCIMLLVACALVQILTKL